MENYILQKTEKWPKSWDIHIINSSKLYFEDKKIIFIDGYINEVAIVSAIKCSIDTDALGFGCDGINLNLFFSVNNYHYSISLYRNNKKNAIYGYAYYEDFRPAILDKNIHESVFVNYSYMLLGIEEKTAFDVIKQIEKIIKTDYNDRKKDNGNEENGGGGSEKDPIVPNNPVENLDLEPTLLCNN